MKINMKYLLVQISVAVATIQTSYDFFYQGINTLIINFKALKAVVEKVFLRVALMQELVGPKYQEKSNKKINIRMI
jgi:hypothetical protein